MVGLVVTSEYNEETNSAILLPGWQSLWSKSTHPEDINRVGQSIYRLIALDSQISEIRDLI